MNRCKTGDIRAKKKETVADKAIGSCPKDFDAMNLAIIYYSCPMRGSRNFPDHLEGEDMGILIGKRGQTLDSLQYLVSLIVNKGTEGYLRVKLDTENYRERRKGTLKPCKRHCIQIKQLPDVLYP